LFVVSNGTTSIMAT